ncbi:hypothetical protein BCV70DRAFT_197666 [Testicularia cyperi]|uniref:Uncharacterized protein n=1 Tax=Testicularia cyperi TaxID=1882483 RepID=A0A317XYT1_9BASI|nr:hypothetical protein BCV70DRAFT_197666 [Testicularia cyperi]
MRFWHFLTLVAVLITLAGCMDGNPPNPGWFAPDVDFPHHNVNQEALGALGLPENFLEGLNRGSPTFQEERGLLERPYDKQADDRANFLAGRILQNDRYDALQTHFFLEKSFQTHLDGLMEARVTPQIGRAGGAVHKRVEEILLDKARDDMGGILDSNVFLRFRDMHPAHAQVPAETPSQIRREFVDFFERYMLSQIPEKDSILERFPNHQQMASESYDKLFDLVSGMVTRVNFSGRSIAIRRW